MAYTDFTPETHVQEAQDGMGFKVWDESIWNGESANTTLADLYLFFINDDEETIEYDVYPLIVGVDTTKFDEYLDRDGHIIDIADLTIGGAAAASRFEDGYYVVRIVYNDGTYAVGTEPFYDNAQAFLAEWRCRKRKLPANLLTWPIDDDIRRKNWDIYLVGLYLEAAEDAVDLGKKVEFRTFMALIKAIFDYYAISECF